MDWGIVLQPCHPELREGDPWKFNTTLVYTVSSELAHYRPWDNKHQLQCLYLLFKHLGGKEDPGYLLLHSKFKASLDYIRGSGMESVVREERLIKNKTLKTQTT